MRRDRSKPALIEQQNLENTEEREEIAKIARIAVIEEPW